MEDVQSWLKQLEKAPREPPALHVEDKDEIQPCDSISNHGSNKSGSKSNVSTTSSARVKAEAKMAALIARQKLLKEKHALEEQEEQLRKKK